MDYKKIMARLQICRTFIPMICFITDLELRKIVEKDMDSQKYQCIYKNAHTARFLNWLLINDKPFRSIFYFRLKKHKLAWAISQFFLRDVRNIEISGRIGGGAAYSMGRGQ